MNWLSQDTRSGRTICGRLAPLAVAMAMLAVLGCGAEVPPEQQEAMAKLRELGGRINFKRGGYEIDMTKTPIENQDIVHLTKIPNLKTLDLQGTRIGDPAVDQLRTISTLEFVYLQRTIVSREAVASLRKALPNAEVNH